MATFNVVGIDEAIKELDIAAEEMTRRAPAAAKAGGEVAARAMADTAPVRTGQLSGSMVVKGPYTSALDGSYCDVFPDGVREDGERNAEVGFVKEFGRSNMPAEPWMRPAIERYADEIASAVTNVLTGGGSP